MSESATGLRERRAAETRRSLTANARRLTASQGFTGFTVEQLCDEVGVSRRTFFNYFHSKEDAVVGHGPDEVDELVLAEFMSRGPSGGVNLVSELLEVALSHVRAVGLTRQDAADFIAAIEREPQLMQRMMRAGGERERELVRLVAKREGLEPGHSIAQAAVLLTMSITRIAAERFIQHDNDASFDDLLFAALDTARLTLAASPADLDARITTP